MKNIISIILFAGFIAGFVSCSDFLNEDPKSSITSKQFYTTEAQALSNVTYLYRIGAPAQNGAGSAYAGPAVMLGGYMSGYFDNEYAGQELDVYYSKLLSRTDVNIANRMDGIWDACYKAINVANGAIKYIPAIPMSDDTKARLIAEAKFFRAFNYFFLVKMFDAIPLTVAPYEKLDNLYLPRTAAKDIYALIISDLEDAVKSLPATTMSGNNMRITKNVANTLLANACLQMSGYPVRVNNMAKAATAAKAVIASNLHELTTNEDLALKSAFNKLRTTDGLKEAIYSYEYNSSISNSGWWPTYSFPNKAAGWDFWKYSITNNVYGVSNGFLNVYDTNEDLRVQPNQFFHWEYKKPNGQVENLGATCNWYYFDEQAMLSSGRGTKDVNIYRYAEILLIAAEAVAETETVAAAAGYLAEVKARASLTGKTAADFVAQLSGLSKDAFTKEVWAERLREFPLEFKIWDDIIRTRMYPQFNAGNKGTVSFVNVVGASNNWGKTYKITDLLWPISINEMQRNPALGTNNPGFAN